jgi:enoyl-CoA hydratase
MAWSSFREETIGDSPGLLLLTVHVPPSNALSLVAYREIIELFGSVIPNSGVKCVILTGSGEKAFISGSDIGDFLKLSSETVAARNAVVRRAFETIRLCPVPVIGAINGAALGAGLVVASCCDALVASEKASFGLPEINVGVMGGTKALSRLVPWQKVRWMALSGKRLSADDLCRWGSVEAVVSGDKLLSHAVDMARIVASKSPTAIRLQKHVLAITESMNQGDGYQVEQLATGIMISHPDSKEAASAYLEHREPKFIDVSDDTVER